MSDLRNNGIYNPATSEQKPAILLVGYNGANNTGSEARLIAILEDIRAVFGHDARITIPTFNISNLKRYVHDSPGLKIAAVPPVYFFSLNKLIKEHELIMLVEGSCYMDTWTTALLRAYLTTTKLAYEMNKAVIAYAVDVGELSPSNLKLLQREAGKTDLIVTRSRTAADTLKKWGITAPIKYSADTAFSFLPDSRDSGFLYREWPEASGSLITGFALVNYFLWPVVIRLCGKKKNCYRWPYYFSASRQRTRKAEEFAADYARQIEKIIEKYGCYVPLICMEQLDEPFVNKIYELVNSEKRKQIRVFSSGKYNASQITSLLRSLDLLVTSRYHGYVLAMQAGIPMVAVGHDLRLKVLCQETGLADEMFLDFKDPDLFYRLGILLDRILKELGKDIGSGFVKNIRAQILDSYEDLYMRSKQNREILKSFARNYGWV